MSKFFASKRKKGEELMLFKMNWPMLKQIDLVWVWIDFRFNLTLKIYIFLFVVGHGPFSHMFDSLFIPFARPDTDWKVNSLH